MNWLIYLTFNFILYSFLGWCLEEGYLYFKTGHFKTDGFLRGTFKPMYGFAISILIYIYSVLKVEGLLLVLCFIVVPTAVEYISGYGLKRLFYKEYWNYKSFKSNFQGIICLRFSVYWSLLTGLVIVTMQPAVEIIYLKFMNFIGFLTLIFMIYILVDFLITLKLLSYKSNGNPTHIRSLGKFK